MSVRLDRVALTDRLVTAGFGYDDADGFVSRLPDARVAPDLAWHDREAQWFAAGPPSTWDAARRNEATQHYLVGHGVDPVWLMTTYGRRVAPVPTLRDWRSSPSSAPSRGPRGVVSRP
jgi:hypothetical protein